jgi:hypothetical protein
MAISKSDNDQQVNPRVFVVRLDPAAEQWLVSEEGDSAPAQAFDSKDAALEAAKKLAQAFGPSRLRVENRRGNVDLDCAYDKDPVVTQLEKFGF